MPISHTHVCARENASSEYQRLKQQNLLNPELELHWRLDCNPVITGDLELKRLKDTISL